MNNPHDRFFKETLTRKENAASFFREYLPEDVTSGLDWRTNPDLRGFQNLAGLTGLRWIEMSCRDMVK